MSPTDRQRPTKGAALSDVDMGSKVTVADAYIRKLADRGIDVLYANAGTDFAPLIEAYVKAEAENAAVPRPVTVPHENVAVAMAMGHYIATGQPQAVMVHVTVGTANALMGLMNAAKGNIPVLMTAGRTPLTHSGAELGAKSAENHWSQEMFDQGSLVREFVKWDYQLPHADVMESAVDRALDLAMSEPRGPVYITLPREVLAAPHVARPAESRRARVSTAPAPEAVAAAARILARAEAPMIVATSAGRTVADVSALSEFALEHAIPVTQRKPRFMAVPTDHPMHRGFAPDGMITRADAILAVECDVPWIPARTRPRQDCGIVHIGADPIHSGHPMCDFPADAMLTGNLSVSLAALSAAVRIASPDPAFVDARRERIALEHAAHAAAKAEQVKIARQRTPIDPIWLTHCLDRVKGERGVVVRELPLDMEHLTFLHAGCYVSPNWAAGLGSGLGVALGIKMARPNDLVICAVGDGSYMFGTPLAAHHVGRAENLPILTLVVDNSRWDAVRRSTLGMYPEGQAAGRARLPLTHFDGQTAYEKVVEAVGGHGERVANPDELPAALERAVRVVTEERRQAVLTVETA